MPAKSKQQQKAAGAALAAKRGKKPKSSLKGASRSMAESMSEQKLRDLAKTKRKSLPRRASKSGDTRSKTASGRSKTSASRSKSAGRSKSLSRSKRASSR